MKYIYYYIFSTFFPNFFLIFFFAKFDGFIMLIACPLDFRFAYRYLSAMRRQNFYFTAGQVICRLSRNIDRGQSDRGDRWKHQHNDGWMSDKCEKFNFNFNFALLGCCHVNAYQIADSRCEFPLSWFGVLWCGAVWFGLVWLLGCTQLLRPLAKTFSFRTRFSWTAFLVFFLCKQRAWIEIENCFTCFVLMIRCVCGRWLAFADFHLADAAQFCDCWLTSGSIDFLLMGFPRFSQTFQMG